MDIKERVEKKQRPKNVVEYMRTARRQQLFADSVYKIIGLETSIPRDQAAAFMIQLSFDVFGGGDNVDIVLCSWGLLSGFPQSLGIEERRKSYVLATGYRGRGKGYVDELDSTLTDEDIEKNCEKLRKHEDFLYGTIESIYTERVADPKQYLKAACKTWISSDGYLILPQLSRQNPDKIFDEFDESQTEEAEPPNSEAEQSSLEAEREKPYSRLFRIASAVVMALIITIFALYIRGVIFKKTTIPSELTISNVLFSAIDGMTSSDVPNAKLIYDLKKLQYDGKNLAKYETAANKGDAEAQYIVGITYFLKGEYEQADRWLTCAADQGYPDAQEMLGFYYYYGYGFPQDYEKAYLYAKKAAENGEEFGQIVLGDCYFDGHIVDVNIAEAIKWYRSAEAKKEPLAFSRLAELYLTGVGVETNYFEALRLYKEAYEGGVTQAAIGIAFMYQNGLGVKKDIKTALEWLRPAAAKGNAEAQSMLGLYYDVGLGVDQDYEEARKWYYKAVSQDEPYAKCYLGYLYLTGRGGEQDIGKGLALIRESAEQNVDVAQITLADIYLSGEYVEYNLIEATEWYRRASELGNEYGANRYEELMGWRTGGGYAG